MSVAVSHDNWIGQVVDGKFPLLRWLGGSESSDVFLTELAAPRSQKAAIKLVPAGDAESGAAWAASRTLSHPHLMRLFQAGVCQVHSVALRYVVMEFAEENLSEIIPQRALTAGETREMVLPIIEALSYLHGQGFVHGHVKPSNVLVVADQLRLSSDRLLSAGQAGKHSPKPGMYSAPELADGRISTAADIWSLGMTMVEALTQHPPAWDRLSSARPAVAEPLPQPFADVARRCLRADPAQRCTLSDIRGLLDPGDPAPALEMMRKKNPREKQSPAGWPNQALAGAAIALLAVGAVYMMRSHKTDSATSAVTQTAPASAPETPVPAPPSSPGLVKGSVVERVMPDVSRSASRTVHGKIKVRVRVAVDENGTISEARLESAGPSQYFAKHALQAARQWKFKPAEVDGRAQASVWNLQFQFGRSKTDVSATETSP